MADPIAPFAPALSELALDAWERVGIQAGALTVTHLTSMRRSMNLVLVRWANRGINLWEVSPTTINLIAGTATYTLASNVIEMLDTYVRVSNSGVNTDIILTPMGRDTYAALPNKALAGQPLQYWFDRLVTPTVTFWPVPDATTTYSVSFYALNQIGDADPAGGNTASIPYRFLEAFTSGLAAHLAIKWAATERAIALDAAAKECWLEAAGEDHEAVTLTLAPDLGPYS